MLNKQRVRHSFALVATAAILLLAGLLTWGQPAHAVGTPPPLGQAASFAVLGGAAVTNTGNSDLWGDLGVSPGTSITGFPPGEFEGARHQTDAVAAQAQSDLTIAFNNAAGQAPDFASPAELGAGRTVTPGVHKSVSGAQLTGSLTLDAQNNPDAVFIFQIPESLTTASNASVIMARDANPCNVFWQIGASATIGSGTDFVGTVMALTSISAVTGADIEGRLLARNALVSLQNNDITEPGCDDIGSSDGPGGDDESDEDSDEDEDSNSDSDESDEDSDEDEDSDSDSDESDEDSDEDEDSDDNDQGDRDSKDRDVVPYGNPATGQGGTATESDPVSVLLLTMSGLAASGAIVVAAPGLRRSRKRS